MCSLPKYTVIDMTTPPPASVSPTSTKMSFLQTLLADTCLSICLFSYLNLLQQKLSTISSLGVEIKWLCNWSFSQMNFSELLVGYGIHLQAGTERIREVCSEFGLEERELEGNSWIILILVFTGILIKLGLAWLYLSREQRKRIGIPFTDMPSFGIEENTSPEEYDFLLFSIALHSTIGLVATSYLLSSISIQSIEILFMTFTASVILILSIQKWLLIFSSRVNLPQELELTEEIIRAGINERASIKFS